MDLNKLHPRALAAAMKGGTSGWGEFASAAEHVRYAQPVRPARALAARWTQPVRTAPRLAAECNRCAGSVRTTVPCEVADRGDGGYIVAVVARPNVGVKAAGPPGPVAP